MLNWRQSKIPFYSVLNLIYYIKSTETTKSRINILRFCSQLWLYFSVAFTTASHRRHSHSTIMDWYETARKLCVFYFHVTCSVRFNFANFHRWLRLLSSAAQSQRCACEFMPCKSVDWIAWSACTVHVGVSSSLSHFFGALILFTRTHAHTRAHNQIYGMDNNDIRNENSETFKIIQSNKYFEYVFCINSFSWVVRM